MAEFLTLIPPGEALCRMLDHLPASPLGTEQVPTKDALGRILAKDVFSPESLPGFQRSSVDGYAVKSADTYGVGNSMPGYFSVIGEVNMGSSPSFVIRTGQSALIHTGGMLPEGADAVVMLENTQTFRQDNVEIFRSVAPLENVILAGEDLKAGELILSVGTGIKPASIGGLMALGLIEIPVYLLPRVGIISTGDEVVNPEDEILPGQVRDSNSYSLSALIQQAGGIPVRYGIVPDWKEALNETVKTVLNDCDMVVITAGSSASARDYTAQIIHSQGLPGVLVHGVNIRPGKPTILGVCNNKPLIGLPGNPVSALVIARLFVVPVIEKIAGLRTRPFDLMLKMPISTNVASQSGREDWIPVHIVKDGDDYQAVPIYFKSNLIFSLVRADGLARIASDATGIQAGEIVEVAIL
jgi:molybdopterin molybdotransferase